MKYLVFILSLLISSHLFGDQNVRDDLTGKLIFDPEFYLDLYPDVAASVKRDRHATAREHWLRHGIPEGRAGSAAYFGAYYQSRHPDIWERFKNGRDPMRELAMHWLEYGIDEGRASSPAFDVRFYLRNNIRLIREIGRNNFVEAVRHFNTVGVSDRIPGSPTFDPVAHLKNNPDLAARVGSRNYYEAALDVLRSFEVPTTARPPTTTRPAPTPETTQPEAAPNEREERSGPAILRRRDR